MKELVTIVLPAYNGQKYIRQMLDSIYMQDYRPLELVISDDASTDDTISVINDWIQLKAEADFSIRLIKNKKNKGLSGNVSNAVKCVHGKYLFLADQDDLWVTDKVSVQVAYMERNRDCIMCICDRCIIDSDGNVRCRSLFRYQHADTGKRDYRKVLNNAILYPANCMCLRTEKISDIFPIPGQIYSHDTFIAVMAAHYGKIGYVKKVLTQYRIHEGNLSRQYMLETNRHILKAGYAVFKAFQRKKQIEDNDSPIIARELEERFHEDGRKCPKKLWGNSVKNVFVETVRYLYENMDRWRAFCK